MNAGIDPEKLKTQRAEIFWGRYHP